MSDIIDLEIAQLQLTKDVLESLSIQTRVVANFNNPNHQLGQIIDEYGKNFRQMFKYISNPKEVDKGN